MSALGQKRIRYDFVLNGTRYRPSILQAPTAENLRRAQEHLKQIKQRIDAGTFNYDEEFPHTQARVPNRGALLTCSVVFDRFLKHCEACVHRGEFAQATLDSYRKILEIWRVDLGSLLFLAVRFSTLRKIADAQRAWSRKTYNNSLSVLRRAFAFGYRDHPQRFNPASALKAVRLHPREQPKPDPFRILEAEALIAGIRADWGEAQANYDEFRFFTGLRPSEQIALTVQDFDAARGTLAVTKACVHGVYKDCTKTRRDRVLELYPRARATLQRQLRLRKRPYVARHTSVSWNLMIGRTPLQNAQQHGHGIATMWRVYSAWTQGASESEIQTIRRAMRSSGERDPWMTEWTRALRAYIARARRWILS